MNTLCTTNTSFRKNKIYQQINLNWYKGPDGSNGKERFFGLAGQPVTSYNGDKESDSIDQLWERGSVFWRTTGDKASDGTGDQNSGSQLRK